MSIWYQYEIDVLAVDRGATAKFFNLDPEKDVTAYADHFKLSFGGKNMGSMRLGKIVEQNPDMIFLVEESVEVDTVSVWLQRFDKIPNEHQRIFLYTTGMVNTKINKEILDLYAKEYPTLPVKHLTGEEGYDDFRWSMFFNDFGKCATLLRRHKEFEEMVNPYKYLNIPTYIIEYECNYGSENEPSFHKEWQGPLPMPKIEAIREKFANYVKKGRLKEGDIRNLNVREVEPR
jgi:hypothetical protein